MADPRIDRPDPDANRRLFAAMFLSLAIYSGYVWWKGPPKPAPGADGAPPVAGEQVPAPSAAPALAASPTASISPLPPVRELPFDACGAAGSWTTEGGVLRNVRLTTVEGRYKVTQVWQWARDRAFGRISGPWQPYGEHEQAAVALSPDAHALAIGAGPLTGTSPRMEVLESSSPGSVLLRGTTPDGIEVTEHVTSGGDPCVLDVDFSWKNTGSMPYTSGLWVGLHDALDEGAVYGTHVYPVALVDGSLDYPKLKNLNPSEVSEGPVSWFSLSDRFFGTFVLPRDPDAGQIWFSARTFRDPATPPAPAGAPEQAGAVQYGEHWVRSAALAPGETFTEPMRVYLGSLDKDVLNAVDPTLPRAINYSWMAAFATPMLWALKFIHSFTHNWGLAIIGLTLIVKAALFPLINAGMKSSMKMAAVQPKMKEIREQYKDDPEEMNRRVMELFRESGANPVGGCLPLLAQLPVFSSLYGVLLSSTELYHAPFLYLRDLSAPDPYSILPVLTVLVMWGQQQMMPAQGNLDPAQQQMMKFMPLIFGLFFFTAPSGLGVYMLVNITLSIAQQWWIKRQFPMTPATPPA